MSSHTVSHSPSPAVCRALGCDCFQFTGHPKSWQYPHHGSRPRYRQWQSLGASPELRRPPVPCRYPFGVSGRGSLPAPCPNPENCVLGLSLCVCGNGGANCSWRRSCPVPALPPISPTVGPPASHFLVKINPLRVDPHDFARALPHFGF